MFVCHEIFRLSVLTSHLFRSSAQHKSVSYTQPSGGPPPPQGGGGKKTDDHSTKGSVRSKTKAKAKKNKEDEVLVGIGAQFWQ
jgi:hypothetical protein